jgi:hypothetical protein
MPSPSESWAQTLKHMSKYSTLNLHKMRRAGDGFENGSISDCTGRLTPKEQEISFVHQALFPKCSGFGGLVVSVLASGTQDHGFQPSQSRRIFRGEKIHSMPSFGGEVKPSVPRCRFVACKRTLRYTWKSESQAKLTGHFSPNSVLH